MTLMTPITAMARQTTRPPPVFRIKVKSQGHCDLKSVPFFKFLLLKTAKNDTDESFIQIKNVTSESG